MCEHLQILDYAEESYQEHKMQESLSVDWKAALYLATQGGALALGLPQESGASQVGTPFDMQCS
jgi:guanine deaminase